MTVLNMDCLEGLRFMDDNSVDSIVTDPPYELGFMGKGWDSTGIAYSVELWREALRVLKPGGHLLSFGGSRTYHRMACAIEDAGFEIRDQIMWVYGSGFPKSLDVSKAIDKTLGAEREQLAPRSVIGHQRNIGNRRPYMDDPNHTTDSDIPATAAAAQWDGWGTALKPAHEPICVARKPLIGTVAANVLAHGTGAINIDGCRIPAEVATGWGGGGSALFDGGLSRDGGDARATEGRWPANLIHDGSDEVRGVFPSAKGQQGALTGNEPSARTRANVVYGAMDRGHESTPRSETDTSAARFFYCAKTSQSERGDGNNHPTVKPIAVMAYLQRLVTPPGGFTMDIFSGSGTSGIAAKREGFRFAGFEQSAEYTELANRRIAGAA